MPQCEFPLNVCAATAELLLSVLKVAAKLQLQLQLAVEVKVNGASVSRNCSQQGLVVKLSKNDIVHSAVIDGI